MNENEEKQFERYVLAFALENTLPPVIEEDGYQSRSRPPSATELVGSINHDKAIAAEELHEGGKARLEQKLAIVSHMLVMAAEKALGGYRGLDATYIRLREASDGTWLTDAQKELQPDADQWVFDQEASDEWRDGRAPLGRGCDSVRNKFLTGEINRLTSLGHAVNVALNVETLRTNGEGLTPYEMTLAGIQIGSSSMSLIYKDDEARIIKQRNAARDGRTKAAAYPERDEWIVNTSIELSEEISKVGKRNEEILAMTQKPKVDGATEDSYRWEPMKTVNAIATVIENSKKDQKK